MRRFTVPFAYIAAVLTLFSTPIKAETIQETATERQENALSSLQKRDLEEEEQHVPIGVRALPHAEWVRTLEMHQMQTEEDSQTTVAENESEEGDFEEVADSEVIAKGVYYTCHPGAIHRPIAVTALGDVVTLHDGSEWLVKYSDRYKTLDWLASDTAHITKNSAWFSSYYYCLTNHMTGAQIEVNMLKGPIYNGVHTHWIIAIDYFNCELVLEDGSHWKIASSDYVTHKKWLINDTVIIGVEDSWWSSKPNILINVNMLNHVSAGPAHSGIILMPIVTP